MCDGTDKFPNITCDTNICIPGCSCKPGYARNIEDECIKFTECKEKQHVENIEDKSSYYDDGESKEYDVNVDVIRFP